MSRATWLTAGFGVGTAWLVWSFGPSPITLAVPAALFLGLLADGIFRPASAVLMPVVTHGDRNSNCVALTFDDGPDEDLTPRILDALRAANRKATFFVIGRHLEACPALAERIAAEGHELGNHSYEHARTLNFAGGRRMEAEIIRGADAVRAVTGQAGFPLYRPPIGLKNPPLAGVARRLGLTVVAWSCHGRDTRGASAAQIAKRVLDRVGSGDIVVLHDGRDRPGAPSRAATAAALPAILEGLQARGLEAVTVSELLRRSGGSSAADAA